MTKFRIVLLKEDQDMIVVSVACTPRVPKGPRIRYDIGEIVAAIREQHPNVGDYIFGATLINYYPDKVEAQFGFKPKKKMLLLEEEEERPYLRTGPQGKTLKKRHQVSEIVRPFDDIPMLVEEKEE